MKFGHIEIPADLINALQDNRVIVFAGAGVSMGEPANLPDFVSLTRQILNLDESEKFDSPDQKLGEGFDQGVKIHEQCIRIINQKLPQPTQLHHDILKLFPKIPKVITTNFDLLFEQAFQNSLPNERIKTFNAPVFPLGNNIEGIIYLHGNINDPRSIVLSDADFGRAYLSESWAKRLLIDAFLNYNFVFIGYSYNDTILKYLTRSLPKNRDSKLYAFANIEEGNVQQINHWQSLGIEPLIYKKEKGSHQQLPESVHVLSEFIQANNADFENLFKAKIQEYEKSNEEDALSYVKYFLTSDPSYKVFYQAAQPEFWLLQIEKDQALFDVLMTYENAFFTWICRCLETHTKELMAVLHKYPTLKDKQSLIEKIFRALNATQNKNCYWTWFLFLEQDIYRDKSLKNYVLNYFVLEKLINFDLTNEFKRALETYLSIEIHPNIKFILDEYQFNRIVGIIKSKDDFHTVFIDVLASKIEEYDTLLMLDAQSKRHTAWTKKEIWEKDKSYSKDLDYDLIHGIVEIISKQSLAQDIVNTFTQRCLNSNSVLLKRLGVYLLNQFSLYDADFVYGLISLKVAWFDDEFRSEIFKFLELRYNKLSQARKTEILSKIKNYFADDLAKIKWFAWIEKFSPKCELVKSEYENLKIKYPNYQLADKPYLSIRYSGMYRITYNSPFTVEEIEKRNDYIWYLALLEYSFDNKFSGPNQLSYEGLWDEIEKANAQWLIEFIDFAIKVTPEHQIIERVIQKAKDWQFDQVLHDQFYDLCYAVLLLKDPNQIYAIAQFLDDVHKIEYYQNNLQQHCTWVEIAQQIVNSNSHTESTISGNRDYFIKSLNSVNGSLAWFVIKLYELAKDEKEIQKQCESFILFLLGKDAHGYALIRVLQQYSFIKSRNSLFAQKVLLPYLTINDETLKLQAWRGFLFNECLEYAEFKEIQQEFFNVLHYALGQNDEQFVKDLTDLYVDSIYFEYHQDAVASLRKLQRLESPFIFEQILDTVGEILLQEKNLDKVWVWLGEYLQDRLYQVNQTLTQNEISKTWYLLTKHTQVIVKSKEIILQLAFMDQQIGFLHNLIWNDSAIMIGQEVQWCEVLAYYLNCQEDRINSLMYEEEKALFKLLIVHDHDNVLQRALTRKGIQL